MRLTPNPDPKTQPPDPEKPFAPFTNEETGEEQWVELARDDDEDRAPMKDE